MNAPTNMPIAPYAHTKHVDAWKRQPDFDLNAKVRVISTHNPFRPGARAWRLFEEVLRPKPKTTIRQILDDAEAIGYFRNEVKSHLRWLYTWGDFMEVNGERFFPKEPKRNRR
jgi:hypothetical protein